jgi:hypothetical protein
MIKEQSFEGGYLVQKFSILDTYLSSFVVLVPGKTAGALPFGGITHTLGSMGQMASVVGYRIQAIRRGTGGFRKMNKLSYSGGGGGSGGR